MSENQPFVSVLMTSFNREKYISEAIESVLFSSFRDFELIIVDDKSTDRTVEIAMRYASKDPRVSVHVNDNNLTDYPNRNKAASYAKGKYIKYLDADDIIYEYGLEVMVNYMRQFPEAGFGLASNVSSIKPFPIQLTPRESYLEHFSGFNHFDRAPGSSIIKLEAFNQVGGFSGKRMIGDFEFWFKIARYFNLVKFPFDLYWNRIHEEQESKSGYAKMYPILRKKIIEDALKNKDCPLNEEELQIVGKLIKRSNRKSHIFNNISRIKTFLKSR